MESLKKAFLVIDMAAILELTVLFFFFFPFVFESVSKISRNLSLFFGIPEVIFIMRECERKVAWSLTDTWAKK